MSKVLPELRAPTPSVISGDKVPTPVAVLGIEGSPSDVMEEMSGALVQAIGEDVSNAETTTAVVSNIEDPSRCKQGAHTNYID
jgi:hypothetical protein